jgi:hypothetical protein
LLETVGKEICTCNAVELGATPSINSVLKKAFSSMGHTNSNLVNLVSSALATIGQQVGELRNEIGLTSHGKSLEEIKQRNNNVDLSFLAYPLRAILTSPLMSLGNNESRREAKFFNRLLLEIIETVGKEICTCNDVELGATPSINSVLKKAFSSMGHTNRI